MTGPLLSHTSHSPQPANPAKSQSQHAKRRVRRPIDFALVNRVALRELPVLLARWLPGGKRHGSEYVVRNPKRQDRRPGSFKVNLVTARWCDFATGDRGGDAISLAAYLSGLTQFEAAQHLARMLGIEAHRAR
jgi:hypothetical protein